MSEKNHFRIKQDGEVLVDIIRRQGVTDRELFELLLEFLDGFLVEKEELRAEPHLRLVRKEDGCTERTPLETLLYHYFGPGFKSMLKDPAAAFPSEADGLASLQNGAAVQILSKGSTIGEPVGEGGNDDES